MTEKIFKKLFFSLILTGALLSSCSTPKDITYMQGFENEQIQQVKDQTRLKVQADDQLSILVSSKDPVLAEAFNLAVSQYYVGRPGLMRTSSSSTSQISAYTVDPDGYIQFPILGPIHVAGMFRYQIAAAIKDQLVSKGLLKDPTVTVEFLNATVSVLGDVAKPGEYAIDKDNLTLLQAISKAGDLNITGVRTNVLVIREENGKDVAYRVDLTDTEQLMQSPAYHIQQNDVVYVEPNRMKKRQATESGNTVFNPTFWISVASLLTTITALLIR